MRYLTVAACLALAAAPAHAQSPAEDEYARIELLSPGSGSFRITYDASATEGGATTFVTRTADMRHMTDISVIDRMTGQPLKFTIADNRIRVALARPIAKDGEMRLRMVATCTEPQAYSRSGDTIAFAMPLDVARDAIVLPANYELVSANRPVQVIEEADGRLSASVMNTFPERANVAIKARALKNPPVRVQIGDRPIDQPAAAPAPADAPPREQPMNQIRVSERAVQDREIVYFLKEPETHAFSLYHDYTASREGEHQYVNVVRAGSSVSEPSAKILDTGEVLKTRVLTGADVAREKIDIPDRVDPDTQLVLIPFTPVARGSSVRLRIAETYTDPARYALIDGQLMWHRSFGRPRNDMVLPAGWYLTASSMPAVISQEPDGRIRLSFWNPRPDSVDVSVKGRRR